MSDLFLIEKLIREIRVDQIEILSELKSHQKIDEKIHHDLSKMNEDLSDRLDKYNSELEIHIKATELNEQKIARFEEKISPILAEITPVLADHKKAKIIEELNEAKQKKSQTRWATITVIVGVVTPILTIAIDALIKFF
jgi:hypothetical protein